MEWEDHPLTIDFFRKIKLHIEEAKDELVTCEAERIRWMQGYIMAMQNILGED